MVLDGHPHSIAASSNGMDRQTLRDWVHSYNDEGVEGLRTRLPPGREAFLTESQMAELYELVIKGPDPAINHVVRWRCCDLLGEVKRRFSVEVHESTIGKWLHKLGLTRYSRGLCIRRKTLRPKRLLKKLRQPGKASTRRNHRGDADRNLVPGRGQSRSEGHSRLYMGAGRLLAADGAR
jgi:transposase